MARLNLQLRVSTRELRASLFLAPATGSDSLCHENTTISTREYGVWSSTQQVPKDQAVGQLHDRRSI